MTEESQRDKEAAPTSTTPTTGLQTWERWVAGTFGAIGVGVGGFAIFLTSNQAGTTAMLLLGALFVLMAVQGTAVRKAARDSVEMDRRWAIARVTEAAEEVLDEEGPDSARAVIEGATAARPEIRNDPQLSVVDAARMYESSAHNALFRVMERLEGYGALGLSPAPIDGQEFDTAIGSASHPGKFIPVEMLYTHAEHMSIARVRHAIYKFHFVSRPGLIISNKTMTTQGFDRLGFDDKKTLFQFVLWRDHNDDRALANGLSRLASLAWYT